MQAAGQLPEETWAALTADVDAEISTAVGFAENGTPEPVSELTRFVYSDRTDDGSTGTAATGGGQAGKGGAAR
jgi:pyruvate dehydrogenase E1 component alpha subunit